MPQVTVRFYGYVRDVAREPAVVLSVEGGSTVQDLLSLLLDRYGEEFRRRVLSSRGELEPNVQVFLGDRQITSLQEPLGDGPGAEAEVKVFVLAASAGGSGLTSPRRPRRLAW